MLDRRGEIRQNRRTRGHRRTLRWIGEKKGITKEGGNMIRRTEQEWTDSICMLRRTE
jgi:hypothetical protein